MHIYLILVNELHIILIRKEFGHHPLLLLLLHGSGKFPWWTSCLVTLLRKRKSGYRNQTWMICGRVHSRVFMHRLRLTGNLPPHRLSGRRQLTVDLLTRIFFVTWWRIAGSLQLLLCCLALGVFQRMDLHNFYSQCFVLPHLLWKGLLWVPRDVPVGSDCTEFSRHDFSLMPKKPWLAKKKNGDRFTSQEIQSKKKKSTHQEVAFFTHSILSKNFQPSFFNQFIQRNRIVVNNL